MDINQIEDAFFGNDKVTVEMYIAIISQLIIEGNLEVIEWFNEVTEGKNLPYGDYKTADPLFDEDRILQVCSKVKEAGKSSSIL